MRRCSLFTLSLALLSSLACAGGARCGEGTGLVNGECVPVQPIEEEEEEEEEETDVVVEDTSPEATDPVIVSFFPDISAVTEGDAVTFVVELTDPQGASDIAIGILQAPGGAQYGNFATTGGSTFTLSLTWEDLNEMNAIDFELEEERVFVAHFVDRSANVVEANTALRLHCGGLAACTGVCTDTATDEENCGTCGATCDQCESGQCYGYECVEPSASIDTCDELCASVGRTCGGDVCGGGSTTGWIVRAGTCEAITDYRIVGDCDTPFTDGYDLLGKCCCAG
ncbi:MAG: hypothetical protein V4850_11620 [Myxococcota bacterium]